MLCLVNAGIKDIPPCELIFLWFGLLYENILIVDTTKLVKDEKRDLVKDDENILIYAFCHTRL